MVNFDKMIDNYVYKENKPPSIGRYWPSQIGSCIRKVWYSYKHPKEIDTELQKIFELGNIMHNFVVDVLKSEKNPHVELVNCELPLKLEKDGFTVSGRVDDIILLKEDGKYVIVEVKSHKNIAYVDEPSRAHIVQIMIYMHVSGIHNGIILYIDKNNLKTKFFEVEYDEEFAKKIIDRIKKLDKFLKENKLPPAEAKYDKKLRWMCKFCEYRERCEKDEK